MSSKSTPPVEAASTLAVIASSNEPLLFLSRDLLVIAARASFCRSFGIDLALLQGRPLSEIGDGEWAAPQLRSLLSATASGSAEVEAYDFDFARTGLPTRHLLLNARKLVDGDADQVRLLLAITDVSEARAQAKLHEDLIREKAVLLQEVQHRIANSLQIIASVLMQSARKVQSEEARGYLTDAHHRVMSIAAVQRQLAETQLGEVALQPYLVQLCDSLAASMIHDPSRLSIKVAVDNSKVAAHASVALGLIVTELVINTLKHAFPAGRDGTITVDYHSSGSDWSLSVTDDGVGMPTGENVAKAGLGTGIVEALARQLTGDIRVTDAGPGTSVWIGHAEAAQVPAAA
jgi:two-component sensor histidine kinase